MREMQILEARLREIDKRRAEIDAFLDHARGGESYRQQELETERRELMTLRCVTADKIKMLQAPVPAPDERREKFIEREVAARRQSTEAFIEQLEREGDHRQARLWRNEMFKIREQVEREFSV